VGLFDNLGGGAAGGDWAKQAADAQALADQMMKDAGYSAAPGDIAATTAAMGADRSAIEAQAHEQNRILSVGSPAKITIVGKTDTGEKVAGNGKYILQLSVVPEGGEAYTVQKEEIIPPQVLSGYADGTTLDGRIDPADRNKVAFGDKPFM
jgi:hypothetical protein